MAPARKRTRREAETEDTQIPQSTPPSLLQQIRNMWEFASLYQYIFTFGKVVKIVDDLDIEDLEADCLKPHTDLLSDIGLSLLKFVSSHRGLNHDIFDEYTRRQYVAKAPERNPFGTDEIPNKFAHFDVFTKIRVLHQLSTWTFWNPDRIRSIMPEKDSEQTNWRIEPFGWDTDDKTYFLLDDDRLYRQTDPPIPIAKPKPKAKSRRSKGGRTSKRRKVAETDPTSGMDSEGEQDGDTTETQQPNAAQDFGGFTWECVAVTMQDYTDFLDAHRRTKDPNEKAMMKRLQEEVIPVIEKRVEAQARKELKRQKELENLAKMATAKRSSRLADKHEKRREEERAEEEERKRQADLAMAQKEVEKQRKMEEARESRMMTREQRLKDREVKRIMHEEELKRLQESSDNLDSANGRVSERHLKNEMERRQRELDDLGDEDEWMFDCSVCGVHGANLDDGSHSIACEKCNVWQHSTCHGIKEEEAERDDFHFVCRHCKRLEEEAEKARLAALKPEPPKETISPPKVVGLGMPLESVQLGGGPSKAEPLSSHQASIHTSPMKPVSQGPPSSMLQPEPVASAFFQAPQMQRQGPLYPPLNGTASIPHKNPSPAIAAAPSGAVNGMTSNLSTTRIPTITSSQGSSQGYLPSANGSFEQRPSSSHLVETPRAPGAQVNGHTNGSFSYPTASSPTSLPPKPVQQLSQTPSKSHASPYSSFSTPQVPGATPGYSPTKQPSPVAPAQQLNKAPVLPPAMPLQPNLTPQIPDPPSKKMSPEQTPQSNGTLLNEILDWRRHGLV